MKKIFAFNILVVFLLSNCSITGKKKNKQAQTEISKSKDIVSASENKNVPQTIEDVKKMGYTFGKVIDKTKTGGCKFVIAIQNSKYFEPVNLDSKFQKDSLDIIFKFRKSKSMTTCMLGQPVVLSDVKPFLVEKSSIKSTESKKSTNTDLLNKTEKSGSKNAEVSKSEATYSRLKKMGYSIGKLIDKSQTNGCSYIIKVNDSITFEPINLDDEFKKDGLEIAFKHKRSRAKTNCRMGQTIILVETKPLREK